MAYVIIIIIVDLGEPPLSVIKIMALTIGHKGITMAAILLGSLNRTMPMAMILAVPVAAKTIIPLCFPNSANACAVKASEKIIISIELNVLTFLISYFVFILSLSSLVVPYYIYNNLAIISNNVIFCNRLICLGTVPKVLISDNVSAMILNATKVEY